MGDAVHLMLETTGEYNLESAVCMVILLKSKAPRYIASTVWRMSQTLYRSLSAASDRPIRLPIASFGASTASLCHIQKFCDHLMRRTSLFLDEFGRSSCSSLSVLAAMSA